MQDCGIDSERAWLESCFLFPIPMMVIASEVEPKLSKSKQYRILILLPAHEVFEAGMPIA